MRDYIKRRQELRREGKEEAQPLNALDFLLAVDDFSRVGALRFRDEDGVFRRAQDEGRRTAPPLVELGALLSASRAVEANKETAADLAYLRGRGTSLGGMRPKCTVIDEDGALSIGKFPSIADERAVTKGEVLALTLAKNAGINAAVARVVESQGLPVALIGRFDRRGDGQRLMYVGFKSPSGHHRESVIYINLSCITNTTRNSFACQLLQSILSPFAGSVHLSSPLQVQARVHISETSNFAIARHTSLFDALR